MTDKIAPSKNVLENINAAFDAFNARMAAILECKKEAMARELTRLRANGEQAGTLGNDNIEEAKAKIEDSRRKRIDAAGKAMRQGKSAPKLGVIKRTRGIFDKDGKSYGIFDKDGKSYGIYEEENLNEESLDDLVKQYNFHHAAAKRDKEAGRSSEYNTSKRDYAKKKMDHYYPGHKAKLAEDACCDECEEDLAEAISPVGKSYHKKERFTKHTDKDDEQELRVYHHSDGSVYGETDKFDFHAKNKDEAHAKAKKMGYVKEGIELTEARRLIVKVNAKGKRRRKILCGKGKKLVGSTCKPIAGKEKQRIRLAQRKRLRTIKRKGSGAKIRAQRLRQRALMKRKSMGLRRKR